MRIIVLEDVPIAAASLVHLIRSECAEAQIRVLDNEFEFNQAHSDFIKQQPNLFVLDMRVRWTSSDLVAAVPPIDYQRTGSWRRAGLRCCRLLLSDERTRDLPIVLTSVLEDREVRAELQGLPPNVDFIEKRRHNDLRIILRKHCQKSRTVSQAIVN